MLGKYLDLPVCLIGIGIRASRTNGGKKKDYIDTIWTILSHNTFYATYVLQNLVNPNWKLKVTDMEGNKLFGGYTITINEVYLQIMVSDTSEDLTYSPSFELVIKIASRSYAGSFTLTYFKGRKRHLQEKEKTIDWWPVLDFGSKNGRRDGGILDSPVYEGKTLLCWRLHG